MHLIAVKTPELKGKKTNNTSWLHKQQVTKLNSVRLLAALHKHTHTHIIFMPFYRTLIRGPLLD